MDDVRTPEEVEAACPADVAEVIPYLRAAGFEKIASMRVLVARHGLSLHEAKVAVHYSDAWADRRARDDAFHAQLERLIEELD